MKALSLQALTRQVKRIEMAQNGIVLSDDEGAPHLALIARDGNDVAALQLDAQQALEIAQWLFVAAVRLDRLYSGPRLRSRLAVTSIVRQVRDAVECP